MGGYQSAQQIEQTQHDLGKMAELLAKAEEREEQLLEDADLVRQDLKVHQLKLKEFQMSLQNVTQREKELLQVIDSIHDELRSRVELDEVVKKIQREQWESMNFLVDSLTEKTLELEEKKQQLQTANEKIHSLEEQNIILRKQLNLCRKPLFHSSLSIPAEDALAPSGD